MKRRLLALCLLVAAGTTAADDAADAAAALHGYFEAFNARQIDRIATEIYSTPVHVGGGATHRVLADADAAAANLADLYAAIDAQAWRESRILDLVVCIASRTLALVDTRYSRIDADGNPIPPAVRTNLYVLQKLEGAWRIVAFYAHDETQRPGCPAAGIAG
ncbi:MAG: hypothetical protein OEW35_13095 [Gammaproteobacteria bacterium]|nr:hypothetical protein [Gammaproteobacteria bacterium]MDH4254365.1 hypothetical protein [Gammaproteobacteria bacterium]MDH5309382.1 hypothetical protein [Gammaproteobacteria bacterium]